MISKTRQKARRKSEIRELFEREIEKKSHRDLKKNQTDESLKHLPPRGKVTIITVAEKVCVYTELKVFL